MKHKHIEKFKKMKIQKKLRQIAGATHIDIYA